MARAYAGCPSTLITRGRTSLVRHSARCRKYFAALKSRLGDSMKSIVFPSESTARYKYVHLPATRTYVSSTRQERFGFFASLERSYNEEFVLRPFSVTTFVTTY